MLEGQCGTWGSIIAASVHVPLVGGKVVSDLPELNGGDLAGPRRVMADFHERMEREGRCAGLAGGGGACGCRPAGAARDCWLGGAHALALLPPTRALNPRTHPCTLVSFAAASWTLC